MCGDIHIYFKHYSEIKYNVIFEIYLYMQDFLCILYNCVAYTWKWLIKENSFFLSNWNVALVMWLSSSLAALLYIRHIDTLHYDWQFLNIYNVETIRVFVLDFLS